MSTFQQRINTMKVIAQDPNLTTTESLLHVYFWLRFEYVVARRTHFDQKARKLAKRLNEDLSAYMFRMEMTKL